MRAIVLHGIGAGFAIMAGTLTGVALGLEPWRICVLASGFVVMLAANAMCRESSRE